MCQQMQYKLTKCDNISRNYLFGFDITLFGDGVASKSLPTLRSFSDIFLSTQGKKCYSETRLVEGITIYDPGINEQSMVIAG
jgi:hypothetical protein